MPKEKGHGEGTITPKANGTFLARVRVDGQRLSHIAKTEREARRWIRETVTKSEQGLLPADKGKVTVEAFLDQWLKASIPSLRPKTVDLYEYTIRLHLKPAFGRLRLTDLRPDHLQTFYSDKVASGLSPRSVEIMHRLMHRVLNDAVLWRLVPRNVADAAKPPKTPKPEIRAWTPEQARHFLDGISGERLEALHKMAIYCGMRQGELLGLKWEDLDWKAKRIQIRRLVHRTVSKGMTTGEPKTARSRRPIMLPDTVVDSLRRWSIRQKEERLLAGSLWQDTGHIFTSRVGTALEPHKVHADFVRLSESLALPRIRFHDLRHTCASLLLSQGVHPKVVQELLGHGSIALTMDTYSHVLPSMQEEAVRAMERVLGAT